MAVKKNIERASLVGAALDLIRQGGWESVSARTLAKHLGISTMPIYTAMGSMDELKATCLVEVFTLLDASQHCPRTANPALDLAVGYVAFAQAEPRLFRFFLSATGDMEAGVKQAAASPDFERGRPAQSMLEEVFASLAAPDRRDEFVFRTWIFTHGLADLVSSGRVSLSDAEIQSHLEAAGGAFYIFETQKEQR